MTQQNLVVGNEWTIEKQVRASDHFLIHTHLTPKCNSKQMCSERKVCMVFLIQNFCFGNNNYNIIYRNMEKLIISSNLLLDLISISNNNVDYIAEIL